MTVLKTFILWAPEAAAELVAFLKAHARPAVEAKKPLQVVVSHYKPKRTNASNRYLWKAVLEPIAEQAMVNQTYMPEEAWHEWLKRRFLPEMCAAGIPKWQHWPDGERTLAMGTSDLNSAEMAEYVERVQAFAVTELGVVYDRDR